MGGGGEVDARFAALLAIGKPAITRGKGSIDLRQKALAKLNDEVKDVWSGQWVRGLS